MRLNLLLQEHIPFPQHTAQTAWDYFRYEMLYITWALMEIALFTPLVLSFLRWTRYWPSGAVTIWLVLLMLLPFNLIRLLSLLGLPQERQRYVMIGALLFIALLSMRTLSHETTSLFDMTWLGDFYRSLAEEDSQLWRRDIALFVVTCLVWWRGIRLSYHGPDIDRAGLRLRVGGLLLAPLIIWISADFLLRSIVPFILLFFTAGLTAVALIRAEQTEYERTGQAASLTSQWLGSIFLAAVAVVLTAATLATIVSGQAPEIIGAWVAPVWLAIRFGTTAVMVTALFVASPILNVLAKIIGFIVGILSAALSGFWEAMQQIAPNISPALTPEAVEQATEAVQESGANDSTKIIWILLMIAVILLVTLALSRLYRQATIAATNSEQIGQIATELVKKPNLWQRALQKLGLFRGLQTAISIRRIYWQMCRAAAGAGYPRLETETPYEYLASLAQVWPTQTADAQLITRAYVKIRYGELPESEAEVNDIRTAWRRLEETQPIERPESETI
jgi:hypothetical protein